MNVRRIALVATASFLGLSGIVGCGDDGVKKGEPKAKGAPDPNVKMVGANTDGGVPAKGGAAAATASPN